MRQAISSVFSHCRGSEDTINTWQELNTSHLPAIGFRRPKKVGITYVRVYSPPVLAGKYMERDQSARLISRVLAGKGRPWNESLSHGK